MSRSPSFSRPPSRQFNTRRPQPVSEVLKRTDAFAALRAGVEQIASLEKDLRELLPDYLGSSVEPGFIKDGVLALFAAHNALAEFTRFGAQFVIRQLLDLRFERIDRRDGLLILLD